LRHDHRSVLRNGLGSGQVRRDSALSNQTRPLTKARPLRSKTGQYLLTGAVPIRTLAERTRTSCRRPGVKPATRRMGPPAEAAKGWKMHERTRNGASG
jgi:hypothetical protein